jgi:hypothetical protein
LALFRVKTVNRTQLATALSGRAKLSGEQLSWLAAIVRRQTPQQYRFEFALWTLPLIAD